MNDDTLTVKLCELVGAIPTFRWDPTVTKYPASVIGVFYGRIDDAPDRAVGIRVYGSIDEDHLNQRRAQVRIRGGKKKRADADHIASIVFTAMQGLSRVGGISGIRRESMTPLGADTNGRDERTENYLIILDNLEVLS